MILFETSTGFRLRPVHLLLMLYRYVSGAYQLGDLSALNYVKGFLDGDRNGHSVSRILSISGHGIGEPEIWFTDRYPGARIEALSFRLLDTQLLQFLRGAGPEGVAEVFDRFREATAGLAALRELLADRGLIPYWELQAAEWAIGRRPEVSVFSDSPDSLPADRRYDLVYVSNSAPYLREASVVALRRHLAAEGWMAVATPATCVSVRDQFSNSPFAQNARELFDALLGRHGYTADRHAAQMADVGRYASKSERIPIAVPAPARSVLVGELLLHSMHEHISDRVRLQTLSDVLSQVPAEALPVKETLELLMIEGEK